MREGLKKLMESYESLGNSKQHKENAEYTNAFLDILEKEEIEKLDKSKEAEMDEQFGKDFMDVVNEEEGEEEEDLDEKEMTRKQINKLPPSDFVFTGKKGVDSDNKYPIHDLAHAKNSLARAAAKGGSTEKQVRAAVTKRYPSLSKQGQEIGEVKDKSGDDYVRMALKGLENEVGAHLDILELDHGDSVKRELQQAQKAYTVLEKSLRQMFKKF